MTSTELKTLLIASKRYATEHRLFSWWCLISTVLLYITLVSVAVCSSQMTLRILCSFLAALVQVRWFVIFHDHQHGTILGDSSCAKFLMDLFGLVFLNPPSVWKRSHDHHHKYNSRLHGSSTGSYRLMTTDAYGEATPAERRAYAASRHPLTMLAGYLTIFLWGMCLRPLLANPRHHADAGLSMLVHLAIATSLAFVGMDAMLLGFILPMCVASCFGAYLFYAQHNFPSVVLRSGTEWTRVDAALKASSFILMGRVMNWLTGNIGYHHVHHLNAKIPFYRLPEAMRGLKELQSPKVITLSLSDIRACLRLKLWDPQLGRLVSFEGR